MKTAIRMAVLAATFAAVPLTAALADRRPTGEEQAIIAQVLLSQGFTNWDYMEFDDGDGIWEIDDAVDQDGYRHDLKLDADFMIIDDRT